MLADEVREDFGVGVGGEVVFAFALQFFAERLVVLDHAVVHERELAALVEMRVRVLVGRFAVSGPPRVADPESARGRLGGHEFPEIGDAAGALARLDAIAVHDCNTRGVVAAIFQAAQAVEEDGRRLEICPT
jgi:hypothetical protein